MLTIDIRHPDIDKFIDIKKDRTKVTGANISIKVRDDFMKAVKSNEMYCLRFPCDIEPIDKKDVVLEELYHIDNNYYKWVNAKDLWNRIIQAAWESAEPGLLFVDKAIEYSPDGVYNEYKATNTNPCGEQWLQPYDSCRLILMNLYSLVENPFTSSAHINYDKLYEVSYEQLVLGDDLVDLEMEHIDRILDKIKNDPEPDDIKNVEIELWKKIKEQAASGRRIGAGITALADMLAALNLKYDSDEALKVIDKVMNTKMLAELDATTDLAILRGSFKGYDPDLEFNIVNDHSVGYWTVEEGRNKFFEHLLSIYPDEVIKMIECGRRNVSWSTIAPAGSVSILTQTSSGCEPVFMPYYMRRKKINPSDSNVRVDFVDQNHDAWQEFAVIHPKFKDWILAQPYMELANVVGSDNLQVDIQNYSSSHLEKLFKSSPYCGATANDIDWKRRVEIQSILQKYTTNAISSTLNLPSTISVDEVKDIYMMSWDMNLKGQTIYRDGCRTGVLVSNTDVKKDVFEYKDAVKRPEKLDAELFNFRLKNVYYTVYVGKLDDKPYEIFIEVGYAMNTTHDIGTIIKKSKGKYYYCSNTIIDPDTNSQACRQIMFTCKDEEAAITRLISSNLRHGADIKFIVEQLSKIDGELFSFVKGLVRILKKYIPDGSKSTLTCPNCNSKNVIFEEGCSKCLDCGHSKC